MFKKYVLFFHIFSLGLLSLLTACGSGGGTSTSSGTGNSSSKPLAPVLTMSLAPIKSFVFSWQDVASETEYKLLENPDGISGFNEITSLPADSTSSTQVVALYQRVNAQYMLQACNSAGCSNSNTINIPGSLEQASGYIKASNLESFDSFGAAVALSYNGKTLAVGAYLEDSNASGVDGNQANNDAFDSGAVYIFIKNVDNIWVQQAYVKASNTESADRFGASISLSSDGNTLAVGAHFESSNTTGVNSVPNDDGNADFSGAAYVFVRNNNVWSQQAYIKASNTGYFDSFGLDVNLSKDGNTLAVGAFAEDSNTIGINSSANDDGLAENSGAVYVFVRNNDFWTQQAYIKASNTGFGDHFGAAVYISDDGSTLAVGANHEASNTTGVNSTPNDDGLADRSGAVYIFVRDNGNWFQQAYIKASNTDTEDRFGAAVSLSDDGNTLAVGAADEDSSSSGINSLPNDDGTAYGSGAVYVFVRNNTAWAQQAYIKADNVRGGDIFGSTVSLSSDGDSLVVSSPWEDSNTVGINGLYNVDGSAALSGAAYVFMRSDGIWSQQAYIKASNTKAELRFGGSVALSGDANTLAVGSKRESSSGIGGDQSNSDAPRSGAVYLY